MPRTAHRRVLRLISLKQREDRAQRYRKTYPLPMPQQNPEGAAPPHG